MNIIKRILYLAFYPFIKGVPLGTYFGIPLRLTSFFCIFVAAILAIVFMTGESLLNSIAGVFAALAVILMLFGSVTLHEFGHALAAKKFGYKTESIMLHPLGGMAFIDGKWFKNYKHEFWITICGPAVNLAIALILLPTWYFWQQRISQNPSSFEVLAFHCSVWLLEINVTLLWFNLLIPCFPMDSARILRSLLTGFKGGDYCWATTWAYRVSIAATIIAVPLFIWTERPVAAVIIFGIAMLIGPAELYMVKKERKEEELESYKEKLRQDILKVATTNHPNDPVAAEQEAKQMFDFCEFQESILHVLIDDASKDKKVLEDDDFANIHKQFNIVMEYTKSMSESMRKFYNDMLVHAEKTDKDGNYGTKEDILRTLINRALQPI